ncbi:MAG: cbb3-type cytochrome c oxidase subunit 3 [Proteobacteria bacterium]|nr:cbb3-type cytochrome c oxidase subunit 3 [Pseudomonadota bacterium]
MMVTFIAIWLWAWSPGHARTFEALSRLPMEERDAPDDAGGERP